MAGINRGTGSTVSERYLANLADRSFLNLWSYPNPFNDKGRTNTANGQELCDLLVVCGDNVLVFSDKSVAWPGGGDTDLCWRRWYRRAVEHSVRQLRGAERWLKQYPDRIFLDPGCSCRLPVELPAADRLRTHLIAVALGAQAACAQHYHDDDGSLMVASNLAGAAHTDPNASSYRPFCFGDVDPSGTFVHVFDETALNLVLREMDTITDFVDYLDARAAAIRERRVFMAASEAEMLACYLSNEDAEGNHLFPLQTGPYGEAVAVGLPSGSYEAYCQSDACKAKRKADRLSYAWDRLITCFSDNVVAGTSVTLDGSEPRPEHAERALRGMALETRTMRRALAEAFLGALEEAERQRQDRFARVVLPEYGAADPECAYVFLVMAFQKPWLVKRGYQAYREIRSATLRAYGDAILYDKRHLKRVIGIAMDASSRVTGRRGGSEDVMLLERLEWTPEAERAVEEVREKLEILVPQNVRGSRSVTQEYPVPLHRHATPHSYGNSPQGNRQQRRAEASRKRRKGR